MDASYWILITHIVSLFPIFVFLWSYKQRKDAESMFIFLKFIFCVTFSLFYHTEHVGGVETVGGYSIWTLLDGYSSTSLIFTTTLYGLRVRPPQYYITSYVIDTIILILYLFNNTWLLITWLLILSCFTVGIFKWRTVYRYILKYPCWSGATIVLGITAATFYSVAQETEYIIYHSAWHCFIFLTAGCGSMLRYKLDEELYPIQRRQQLDSI